MGLTLQARASAYAAAYPDQPASHLHLVQEQGRDVVYGRWLPGQNYRSKTLYYGAYPPTYLARLMTMFGDAATVLHAFSGSLPPGPYVRLDVNAAVQPDVVGSVYEAADLLFGQQFDLVVADPPYSAADAQEYGTGGIDRRRALAALAQVTAPGGHLCWLDTCWPMHSKREWLTVGRIAITRSTNHRLRDLTIFQRSDGQQPTAVAGA